MGIREIVERTKRGEAESNSLAELLEKQKKVKLSEFEALQLDRMIQEERKRMSDLGDKTSENQTILQQILEHAGVDPVGAAEFLRNLSEEDIQKLVLLSQGQSTPLSTVMALGGGGRRGDSNLKEIIEIVKLITPQQQPPPPVTITDVVKIIQAFNESRPASQAQAFSFKDAFDILMPIFKQMNDSQRMMYEDKLEQAQASNVNPRQWFVQTISDLELLGFQRGGGNSNFEVEKMRIDFDRWKMEKEWEQKRWEAEQGLAQQNESNRWDAIKSVFGGVLDKAGPYIDRFTQSQGTANGKKGAVLKDGTVKFPCSKCGTVILLQGEPDSFECPNCHQKFEKNKPPTAPEEEDEL